MKKVLSILMISSIALASCSKDNETEPKSVDCNCGLITEDNNGTNGAQSWYSVDVRNSCSNNVKTFYLMHGDWVNAYPGNDLCFQNEPSW